MRLGFTFQPSAHQQPMHPAIPHRGCAPPAGASPSRAGPRSRSATARSAASSDAGRPAGTPDAPTPGDGASSTRPRHAGGPGSPFSPLQILEHRDVQRLLGHDLLQPRVLLLERLEPLGLVLLQRAVLRCATDRTSAPRSAAACTPAGSSIPGPAASPPPATSRRSAHREPLSPRHQPPDPLVEPTQDRTNTSSGPNHGGTDTGFDGLAHGAARAP